MISFRTRLGKILIWQKFSETWEPDFNSENSTRKNKKEKKIKKYKISNYIQQKQHKRKHEKKGRKKDRSIKKTKEKESLFNNVDKMSISIINIYRRVNNIT